MSTAVFPAGFEHLASHQQWLHDSERERIEARLTTDYAGSKAFYDAMLAELPSIMQYLKTRPVDSGDAGDRALLKLTQSFVEIANAVELYGEPAVPDGANLRLFVSVLDRPHV